MPTVSVLMPAYNAARHIAEAIQSILDQTFTDFELLVIDDGSTDDTAAVIAAFTDPRIRYERNPVNIRIPRSLNRGLELSRGTYIARMDGDDIAHPRRLERQVRYLETHPDTALVGTGMTIFDDRTGRTISVDQPVTDHHLIRWRHQFVGQFHHPTIMVRRAALRVHGLRYGEVPAWATTYQTWEPIANVEDYLLFGLLSLVDRCENLPVSLLRYRVHDQSWSVTQRENQAAGAVKATSLFLSNVLARSVPLAAASLIYFTHAVRAPQAHIDAACALIDEACAAHLRRFQMPPATERRIKRDAMLRKRVMRSGARSTLKRLWDFARAPVVPHDLEERRLVTRLLLAERHVDAVKRLRSRLLTSVAGRATSL